MTVDVEALRVDLQFLVDDLRHRAGDYTAVMYYRDGELEYDQGRRTGYDIAADEIASAIGRHFEQE